MKLHSLIRSIGAVAFFAVAQALLFAGPNGQQTVTNTGDFVNFGSTITGRATDGNPFLISGSTALGMDSTGAYLFGGGNGAETMTVTASGSLATFVLTAVDINEFSNDGTFVVSITGVRANNTTITSGSVRGTSGPDTYDFSSALSSFANEQLKSFVINVNGNGSSTSLMSLLSFTVANATAIPEPSTYAALIGAGMLGFAACRRRRKMS